MKMRMGFVSNSSSTSFVVAIPEHVSKDDEPYIQLFEKIVSQLKAKDDEFGYGFMKLQDLIENYDDSISKCKLELKEYERFYNQVAEFMHNKSHQAAVQLFLDIVEKERGIEYLKHYVPKKQLSEIQSDIQKYIIDTTKKLNALETEKEQVVLNSEGAKYILSFTLDQNWTSHIEDALKTLIEHGVAKLVKRTDS
jgi:hypothetical protein